MRDASSPLREISLASQRKSEHEEHEEGGALKQALEDIADLNRQKEEIDNDATLNKKRKQNLKKKLRKKLKKA